jgi:hypothetical protein
MPDLIIVKLLPTKPTLPSQFRHVLEHLTVTAYDRTVDNSIEGVPIGSASGLLDPFEKVTVEPGPIPLLKKSIMQTLKPKELQIPLSGWVPDGPPILWSVATAVIVARPPPGHPEYRVPNSFDLRITVDRQDIQLVDPTIEYNINVVSINEPQQLSTDQSDYIQMPSSAYFSLPVEVFDDSSRAVVTSDTDGGPPDFKALRKAINMVLLADHPNADKPDQILLEDRMTPLTAQQCAQIAAEITWNRSLNPTPVPPNIQFPLRNSPLENMYTLAASNDQKVIDDSEKSRREFESALKTYHSTLGGQTTRLATFIAAASAAVVCERLTASYSLAGITFPVEVPGTANNSSPPVTTASVILEGSGSGPLDPPFIVPAIYFYTLAAKYPTQISIKQRYLAATMSTEEQLRTQFQAAIDTGLLHTSEPGVTKIDGKAPATAINLDQAARRLASLGSALGQFKVDVASVKDLVVAWLAYDGLSANMTTPNTGFWATVISKQGNAYVTLVLQAVTLGQTDLVAEIKKQLNPVDVTALGKMTSADWLDFFTKHETLLPNFTGHGSVQQRAEVFIQRLQKFFTVSSSITSSGVTNPLPVPSFGLSPGDPFYSFLGEYKKIQNGKDLDFAMDPDIKVIE